ncbi:ABC transporter substrate-binding protein [Desulfosporosinus youngiae]|uniref:ABC-type dipeptide transport system, periplasmic component n=1 Tax=Desulfosporosinus youngiae DSM 17734 TaxID=768710 RepID=H5Y650_9FIRM|nr:ABC transporter substrate-binding protein [Desulfosporosinus youngiae]EHQ91060.1 ABC-type dipeptide transport system, periplasmic component [Desulfosporosinus youngiae DSM 17734]
MKKNLKSILALLISLLFMISLTACGSSPASTASTGTPGPKVMKFGSTGYFATEKLDPANGWDGWYMTYDGTLETLFKLDQNCVPQPCLVKSYENVDNLTWVFTLRDDVTFQNGEKMTAAAVKKCFERTYQTNSRAKAQISIKSLEADGQKLTFQLEKPSLTLIYDLSDPLWSVYDAEKSNYTDTLYGTGPYKITKFEPFKETVVVKYASYWGGEPKLDEAHLITVSDTDALTMALQNGEIDMAVAMPVAGISLFANNKEFVVDAATTSRGNRLYFNMDRAAMKDSAVRQAIAMCIDREGIVRSLYNGMAEASYGFLPAFLPYGGSDGLKLSVSSYNPEGAKQLLADAGYADTNKDGTLDKNGTELSLKIVTFSSRKELGQFCELLQSELANIGIKLKVDILESVSDVHASGDYDLECATGVMVPTGNAQYFFNIIAVTGASSNWSHYSNTEVDRLAKELEATSDEGKRNEIIRSMVQIMLDDNMMTVYNHQKLTNIYSSQVTGFKTHPSEYYLLDVNTDIVR